MSPARSCSSSAARSAGLRSSELRRQRSSVSRATVPSANVTSCAACVVCAQNRHTSSRLQGEHRRLCLPAGGDREPERRTRVVADGLERASFRPIREHLAPLLAVALACAMRVRPRADPASACPTHRSCSTVRTGADTCSDWSEDASRMSCERGWRDLQPNSESGGDFVHRVLGRSEMPLRQRLSGGRKCILCIMERASPMSISRQRAPAWHGHRTLAHVCHADRIGAATAMALDAWRRMLEMNVPMETLAGATLAAAGVVSRPDDVQPRLAAIARRGPRALLDRSRPRLARVQRPRAAPGAGRPHAAARAAQVPRDLFVQSRRILHEARRRAARSGAHRERGRSGGARGRRFEGAAEAHPGGDPAHAGGTGGVLSGPARAPARLRRGARGLERARRRPARGGLSILRPQRVAGAYAARLRSGAPVPVHLQSLDQLGLHPARARLERDRAGAGEEPEYAAAADSDPGQRAARRSALRRASRTSSATTRASSSREWRS